MAAKVFDGFFLGDSETSMDAEFLDLNKISRLVNVASQEISNVWAGHGFVYDNYNWEDQPEYLVFPAMEKDRALQNLVEFIDVSLKKGESVLVFSLRGTSRSVFAACAYLMYKYNWGFEKSYDFLLSKKSDIHINQGFVQQLFCLERKLYARRQITDPALLQVDTDLVRKEILRRREWDPVYLHIPENNPEESARRAARIALTTVRKTLPGELDDDNEGDELLLINSFLNSKNTLTVLPGPYMDAYNVAKNFKLRFNSVVQEEDIHMFPTNPSAPNMKAKFGILKRRKRPQSMMIKKGADSSKAAPTESRRITSVPSAITFIPGINGTTPVTTDASTTVHGKEKLSSSSKSSKKSSKKDLPKDSSVPGELQALSPRKSKKSSKRDKESPTKNRDSARENKRDSVSRSRESRNKESSKSTSTEGSRTRSPLGQLTDSSSTKSSPRATTCSLTSANAEGKDQYEYGSNGTTTKSEEDAMKNMNTEQRSRNVLQHSDVIGPGGSPRGDDKYDLKGRLGFAEDTTNKTTITNKTIVCKGSDKSVTESSTSRRPTTMLSAVGRGKGQSKEIRSSTIPVTTSEHSVGGSVEGSSRKNSIDNVKIKSKDKNTVKTKDTVKNKDTVKTKDTVKNKNTVKTKDTVKTVIQPIVVTTTRDSSPDIISASHKEHTPSNLGAHDSINSNRNSNSDNTITITVPVKESMSGSGSGLGKSNHSFARVLKSMTYLYPYGISNTCHYSSSSIKRTISVRGPRNH